MKPSKAPSIHSFTITEQEVHNESLLRNTQVGSKVSSINTQSGHTARHNPSADSNKCVSMFQCESSSLFLKYCSLVVGCIITLHYVSSYCIKFRAIAQGFGATPPAYLYALRLSHRSLCFARVPRIHIEEPSPRLSFRD